MLPLLLPCNDPAARDIMAVIGECGSAKEVVLAVQEAVEQMESLFDADEAVGDNDAQRGDNKEERTLPAEKFKLNSPITQLTILIDLYGSCKFWIGRSVYGFLMLKCSNLEDENAPEVRSSNN